MNGTFQKFLDGVYFIRHVNVCTAAVSRQLQQVNAEPFMAGP
jgi:hypothetical protein